MSDLDARVEEQKGRLKADIVKVEEDLKAPEFEALHAFYIDESYDRVHADHKSAGGMRAIIVGSGKGGVGKTTYCVNAAAANARLSHIETYTGSDGGLIELISKIDFSKDDDEKARQINLQDLKIIQDVVANGTRRTVIIDIDLDKANVLSVIGSQNLEYQDTKTGKWKTYIPNDPDSKDFNMYLGELIAAMERAGRDPRRKREEFEKIDLKDYLCRVKGYENFFVCPTTKSQNPNLKFNPDEFEKKKSLMHKIVGDTKKLNADLFIDSPAGAPFATLEFIDSLENKFNVMTLPILVTEQIVQSLEDSYAYLVDLMMHSIQRRANELSCGPTLEDAMIEFWETPVTLPGYDRPVLLDKLEFNERLRLHRKSLETTEDGLNTITRLKNYLYNHQNLDYREKLIPIIEETIERFKLYLVLNNATELQGDTSEDAEKKTPQALYELFQELTKLDYHVHCIDGRFVSQNDQVRKAGFQGGIMFNTSKYQEDPENPGQPQTDKEGEAIKNSNYTFTKEITRSVLTIYEDLDSGADIHEAAEHIPSFDPESQHDQNLLQKYATLRRKLDHLNKSLKAVEHVAG